MRDWGYCAMLIMPFGFQEEYRTLLLLITTGDGAAFPGSYKKMLLVADRSVAAMLCCTLISVIWSVA